MMALESASHAPPPQTGEWGAAFALLPIVATIDFYALPASLQEHTIAQFTPQIVGYLALALWSTRNRDIVSLLGLEHIKVWNGLRWGLLTGLLLGCLNTFVILSVYPHLGYDNRFLETTPHARLPFLIMMPWFICGIALFVEVNFRGFILGRLFVWGTQLSDRTPTPLVKIIAIGTSAGTFAFDPFMVNTFQHLHWIALWDGLIWGMIWLRTQNLYTTIVAHAIEVMVMYGAIRIALIP